MKSIRKNICIIFPTLNYETGAHELRDTRKIYALLKPNLN